MRETVGGVQTNSYSQFSTSQEDNLAFNVSYTNLAGDSRTFVVFADSAKMANTTVAANTTGTWYPRTNWPILGSKRFYTKYNNPATQTWDTSLTGNLHSVNPAIKMVNVRLWNTTIAGVTTTATAAQLQSVLDDLSTSAYAWSTSRSVDAIYTQCGGAQAEWGERIQFRFVGMGSSTPNLTSCTLNERCDPLPSGGVGVSDACRDQAFNIATNNGASFNELHIFSIPNFAAGSGFVGCNSKALGGTSKYAIMIANGMWNQINLSDLIAHEIGHTFYGHGNTTCPWASCGPTGCVTCDPKDKNKPPNCLPVCSTTNSLMCGNMGFCGRVIRNDDTGCDRHNNSANWVPTPGTFIKDVN